MSDESSKPPYLGGIDLRLLANLSLAHEHLGPSLEAVRLFQERMQQPLAEAARQIQERMQPLAEAARQIQERMQPLVGVGNLFFENFADFSKRLQPYIEQTAKIVDAARKGFEARLEYYPSLLKHVTPLAHRGWFLSEYFGMSELDQLAVLAKSESIENLEKRLSALYEEDFEDHLDLIVQAYPHRELVLRQAAAAHARGEYALSVMGFFSQADGICSETTKRCVFSGTDAERISSLAKDKINAIKRDTGATASFEDFFDLMTELMWSAILEKLPIAYNETQRLKNNYDGLNRNTVLHGIAKGEEYSTKENSLKVFSLLSYISCLAKSHADDQESSSDSP